MLKEEDENARSTSPRPPKQSINERADPAGKTSRRKKSPIEPSQRGGQTPLILRALFEDDADEGNPSAWLNTNTSQVQVLEAKHIAGAGTAKKAVKFQKPNGVEQRDQEMALIEPSNTALNYQEIHKVETLEILRTVEETPKPELERVKVTLDNIDINQLGPMYIQKHHRSRRASPGRCTAPTR